jgi:hypothetical protein
VIREGISFPEMLASWQLNGNHSLARQLQDAAKNKGVARRLLEQAKFKYPDKSD